MLIANHSYLLIKAASPSSLLGNQALVWNSISQNGVLEVIWVKREEYIVFKMDICLL